MFRKNLLLCSLLCFAHWCGYSQGRYLLTHHWDTGSLRKDLVSRDDWRPFPAYSDRASWEKVPALYRASLIRRGEQLLRVTWRTVPATAYLEFVRSGDIFGMQSVSDENFNNLKSLVLAELCEGKGRFLDAIINGVWAICERSSWVLSPHLYMQKAGVGLPDVEEPVVDLFSGNTASLLAWAHYFFQGEFDRINPLISRRIRYEIDRRVLQPFYRRNDFWWLGLKNNSFVNNWNIWCNSNILNCILLMEDDPTRRVEGIYKTMSSVDRFINGYPDDGACEEGPMYWFRAGGNVYRYLTFLSRATNGHIDLFGNELIRNIGRYIERVFISGDYYVNFADATARIEQDPGLIYRYGLAIQDPRLEYFGSYLAHRRHWEGHLENAESLELSLENLLQAREVLAFASDKTSPSAGGLSLPADGLSLPAADWFAESRIAIARDKAGCEKGFYFAARAGNNGAGHGHNDAGSFILYYNGHPLLIDVGRAAYTRQTFGPDRYALWYNRSDYHNLPRINGVDQHAGGNFAACHSMFSDSGLSVPPADPGPAPPIALFASDIAGAYPDSARCTRWVRSYRLDRGRSFTILDDYQLSEDRGGTCLYFMTANRPVPVARGRLVWFLPGGSGDDRGKSTALEMSYDKNWKVTVEAVHLTDTVILQSWPPTIYRILFRPPTSGNLSGKDSFQVRAVGFPRRIGVQPKDKKETSLLPGFQRTASPISGRLVLPSFFSDSMVLQRNKKIPVWGWGFPGEKIEIRFRGRLYSAIAGQDGKWMVHLPPMSAGGPYEMKIAGRRPLKGILIGDVWVCSGQSNMEFKMNAVKEKYASEIASSSNNRIRTFSVFKKAGYTPVDQVESDGWKSASPVNTLQFSAVAYFFARQLEQKYHIPIGLVETDWSGTPAESWTSPVGLKDFPEYLSRFHYLQDTIARRKLEQASEQPKRNWNALVRDHDPGYPDSSSLTWADPGLKTSGWKRMELPGFWEEKGLKDFDGIVWFRKEIDVPASLAGKEANLSLSYIDDIDSTYFNGRWVGSTDGYLIPRRYTIPGTLVRAGTNTIAVRVLDLGGNGGLDGRGALQLTIGKDRISLNGTWAYRVGVPLGQLPPYPRATVFYPQYEPAVLYNGMLAPLLPMAIKGVIWYQGEANVNKAAEYRTLFPALIEDWRRLWKQGVFPFLFVQLANLGAVKDTPSESSWALLREAQSGALNLPNTGMAVTHDLGEANNIHPADKKDVGVRLALAARKVAYGDSAVVWSGPVYRSMKVDHGKLVLSFTNVGGGLVAKGRGVLRFFAIAGADKKFAWAKAMIAGNTVIVWNDSIPQPAAVRYGWADNPEGANLYNREGLPASSFQVSIPADRK